MKVKREYWRCKGCFWFWKGDSHCYCVCGEAQGDKVNPGWFGCWRWIAKDRLAFFAELANQEPSFIADLP